MAFLETPRFPESISVGAVGGANYKTDIVTVSSGYEQRNIAWSVARASYDVSHSVKERADLYDLINFFRSVKGMAHGFRFKDWSDYEVSSAEGVLGTGIANGQQTYQLAKKYEAGALYEIRDIRKPVVDSYTLYRNGSPLTEGTSAGNYAIDTTTGIVTFVADSVVAINSNVTRSITAITKANPAVVTTSASHGFVTGDKVRISGVGGMTQVNNLYFTVTYISPTTFSIGVNSTAYTTYTSGGTVIEYGASQTNPVQIQSTGHGLTNGKVIRIDGVGGMTQLNGQYFTVANATTNSFELSGINGTSYSAMTTAGSISIYANASDTLTWEGEFDVPCRFNTDKIEVELITQNLQGWNSIPIIEIKV